MTARATQRDRLRRHAFLLYDYPGINGANFIYCSAEFHALSRTSTQITPIERFAFSRAAILKPPPTRAENGIVCPPP